MGNKSATQVLLCIAIIIGFFLPWFKDVDVSASGWAIVSKNTLAFDSSKTAFILRYSFLLIPIFALVVLVRSSSKQSTGFFVRAIPFLVMAILTGLFILGSTKMANGEELRTGILHILSYGFYISSICSFLLIFISSD